MLKWISTFLPRNYSRSISTTAAVWKQPPNDRQRYKRHHQEPRHTVPFIDEAPLDHLPRRPPEITGLWGSTDPAIKAQRFKDGLRLETLPTTFDKLQELYYLEQNLWYHSLDLPLEQLEMLDFCQQLTRTNVIYPWEPEPQSDYPFISEYMTYAISEYVFHLNRFPLNQLDMKPEAVAVRNRERARTIAACMEAFYQAWSRLTSNGPLNSRPYQLDERGTVETFFKRRASPDLFALHEDVVEDVFDEVNDTVIDSKEQTVRYRIRSELAWQLRGPDPLQPFVAWDDPKCFENHVPPCNYRPEAFDLKPVDCFRFSCLPHTETLDFSDFARSVAGYWSRTPFWEGDPCEFGHFAVLDVARSEKMRRNLEKSGISEKVKQDVLIRHALSEGILTAFAWTSAQAYNQGFTLYNELTYPFATQLLLMDGDHIQLMRYQLNSLTSLWKADDCGLPFNIAWLSPKVRLYEVNPDLSNKVILNPQALGLLVSAMQHPVDDSRSSQSLRPYLSENYAPRDRLKSYTDQPSLHLIPDTDDSLTTRAETATASQPTALSTMSKLEQEALEASKRADREIPLRMFTPARPHPNDVFFLKMTDRSELVQELMEEMPDFGGHFSRFPEPHASQIEEYKLKRRSRQPRQKVQAPPRRWR